ncbi:MAG: PKD domain-containing protein [Candidatus Heimdallarchaeota archaeon]|nr:PKD domain-containing protein [Candidatus Heimdallarchaeota archaeon]MCK4955448.1 PKD domain-containing protein [Candidatus Heimdallarchaeota archaeon]
MKNKKASTVLLLMIITFSFAIVFTTNNIIAASDAEPIFEGFTAEGYETFDGINFPNVTLITVEYSVDRLVGVSGVAIVGSGSNLDLDPSASLKLNYSHSLVDRSYYTGSFNLTGNTIFKGYGWIGLIANGTYEQVEIFNHLGPWHYLFVIEEGLPPEFDSIINATETIFPNLFYAPSDIPNYNISISYRVYGGTPNDNVTLAVSVYRDKITNASLNIFDDNITFIKLDWYNTSHTQYQLYNTTLSFSERTLYFCANNSYGWDTWGASNVLGDILSIFRINNGFYFESETILNEQYTDVDNVEFTVKSYNATDVEKFGIQYYVIESNTNDTEIIHWTMTEGVLDSEYNITKTNGYNDTIREYNVSIGLFELGNVVYYEAYNNYYGEIYNETTGIYKRIEIFNSVPQLSVHPLNGTYTNNETVTFTCDIELVRGNITGVLFDYGDTSPLDNLTLLVEEEDNREFVVAPHTYNVVGVSIYFTVILYVNTSLGTSNFTSSLIYLDFTAPDLEISQFTNNETAITDGYVELRFNYSDDYSGILYVYIDWDDGTILNVTDENYAFHYYTKSGNYTMTVMIKDKAGNELNTSIVFKILLPVTTPTTAPTPFAISLSILSFLVTGYILFRRKKIRIN